MAEAIPVIKKIETRGRTLDYAAGVYDILSPFMTFGLEDRIAGQVIDRMLLPAAAQVLDIGCGTGSLTIQIAQKVSNDSKSLVVGLDAADRMLEVARKKAKQLSNIRFDYVAAEALPYPDSSFDSAISAFFFHHIDLELKKKVLEETYRVLKPGSRFVIVDVGKPTHLFGAFCAWAGYWLFQQEEIRENIDGLLEQVIAQASFSAWKKVSQHLGYVSVYELIR